METARVYTGGYVDAFAAGDEFVATASYHAIEIFDRQSLKITNTIQIEGCTCLYVSNRRGLLLAGTAESILAYDTRSFEQIARIDGDFDRLNAICMLGDSMILAGSNRVIGWDIDSGEEVIRTEEVSMPYLCLTAVEELSLVCAGGNGLAIWHTDPDHQTLRLTHQLSGRTDAIAFSTATGKLLLGYDNALQIFDPRDASLQMCIAREAGIIEVEREKIAFGNWGDIWITKDGDFALREPWHDASSAVYLQDSVVLGREDKTVLRIENADELRLPLTGSRVLANDSYVLATSDNSVSTECLETHEGARELLDHEAVCLENGWLVTLHDGTMRLHLLGSPISAPKLTLENVRNVSLSHSGRFLYTSDGNAVRLWGAEDSQELASMELKSSSLACICRDQYLVVANKGKNLGVFEFGELGSEFALNWIHDLSMGDSIESLIVLPCQTDVVVTGLLNGHIEIWNWNRGQLVSKWRAHEWNVHSLAAHPTQAKIVSTGQDGEVREWNLSSVFE